MFLPADILIEVEPELKALGDRFLSQDIFDAVTDAEKSVPYLRGSGRDAFGRPTSDSLVVTEGWTKLENIGIENGSALSSFSSDHDGLLARPDSRIVSLRTTMTKNMLNTIGFCKC